MKITIGNYQIRNWTMDDVSSLVKYADNPKVAENLRDAFPSPYRRDDAEAFISRIIGEPATRAFAIASGSEAIGSIGLLPGEDVHRLTAEMGYWLAEPFWGKGIMTSAVIRFCDYGFDVLGLNRIYAEPYAHNHASVKVLEKAGFQLEGRLRASVLKHDKVFDQFLYSKIRDGVISEAVNGAENNTSS